MRDALEDVQDSMRELGVRGNYSREENLHLTLAFIGEFPDPRPVLDVISEVRFAPFTITLSRTGSFHKLWWAGIEDSAPLRSVVKQLRRGLADAGIPFDRKKFSPHITLIRNPVCRNGLTMDEVLRPLPGITMTVDHLSLMRSDRGKAGMIYTEITDDHRRTDHGQRD